jgi:hypothetical protein
MSAWNARSAMNKASRCSFLGVVAACVLMLPHPSFAQTSNYGHGPGDIRHIDTTAETKSLPLAGESPSTQTVTVTPPVPTAPVPTKADVAPHLFEKTTPAANVILPPLYGWNHVVLKNLKMPDEAIVKECGLQQDMIMQLFLQRLHGGGLPLVSDQQADSYVADVVKVVMEPTIITMQDVVINCISWIQLKVTVDYTFRVPPLMYRRKMPLLLWHDGMMVASAKSTHNGAVVNGFSDLGTRFLNAWNKQRASVDPESLK